MGVPSRAAMAACFVHLRNCGVARFRRQATFPRHVQRVFQAWLFGTSTELPRHFQGTIAALPRHFPTALPRHLHNPSTTLPRHLHGTSTTLPGSTTTLSPYLALGCLSPRTFHAAAGGEPDLRSSSKAQPPPPGAFPPSCAGVSLVQLLAKELVQACLPLPMATLDHKESPALVTISLGPHNLVRILLYFGLFSMGHLT